MWAGFTLIHVHWKGGFIFAPPTNGIVSLDHSIDHSPKEKWFRRHLRNLSYKCIWFFRSNVLKYNSRKYDKKLLSKSKFSFRSVKILFTYILFPKSCKGLVSLCRFICCGGNESTGFELLRKDGGPPGTDGLLDNWLCLRLS